MKNLFKYKTLILMFLISVSTSIASLLIYSKFYNRPVINYNSVTNLKNVSGLISKDSEGFSEIVRSVKPSIVFVQTIKESESSNMIIESGSGVIITSDGFIVTNAHVIRDHKQIMVTTNDNFQFEAELIGTDELTDIAVLKISKDNLPFLYIENSNNVDAGDISFVFGNPFRLRNSVSIGIISAKNRNLNLLGSGGTEAYIQTDALANSGNSGGALVNTSGKLIGLIAAVNMENEINPGFTFAIPSNIVKKIAFDLINYKAVQRARLGIGVKDVQPGRGDTNYMGAQIQSIDKAGPAFQAGMKVEDMIIRIDTVLIENSSHFQSLISEKKPGDVINISVIRNKNEHNIKVTLKNAFNTDELIANRKDKILADLGITLRDLTENEIITLNTTGVLVMNTIKGSKAQLSNIEPDYIIQELNSEKILNVDDLIEKIRKSGNKLKFNGFYRNYPGMFPYILEK
jgi:serine protease Do